MFQQDTSHLCEKGGQVDAIRCSSLPKGLNMYGVPEGKTKSFKMSDNRFVESLTGIALSKVCAIISGD